METYNFDILIRLAMMQAHLPGTRLATGSLAYSYLRQLQFEKRTEWGKFLWIQLKDKILFITGVENENFFQEKGRGEKI